jgi:hypothetical protein
VHNVNHLRPFFEVEIFGLIREKRLDRDPLVSWCSNRLCSRRHLSKKPGFPRLCDEGAPWCSLGQTEDLCGRVVVARH